jgi:hypothetical protein
MLTAASPRRPALAASTPYSRKREHVLAIESAKKVETRTRLIEKALATLRDQESAGATGLDEFNRQRAPRCGGLLRVSGARLQRLARGGIHRLRSLATRKRCCRCGAVGVFITVTAAAEPARLTPDAGTCSASSRHRCRRTSGTTGYRRCRGEKRAAAAARWGCSALSRPRPTRPGSPRTAGTCSTSSTHRFRRHSAA